MEPLTPDDAGESLSLADRLPDYVVTFGIGLIVSTGVGVVIWLISDIPLAATVGYTIILYGIVMLLAGGAAGGGYTSLGIGGLNAMFGGGRPDEVRRDARSSQSHDPYARLREGLRPEANPRAFWQVIAGVLYLAVGLMIVIPGT
ncbi:MAG: hypothetical protein QGD89_08075 [Actinomycetota bacterium]|nr:hypothetical protein [Actinomycetota bacterium]